MEVSILTKPELNQHISAVLRSELKLFRTELLADLKTDKNFTVKEAADYLNVSQISIHNYRKKGLLPVSKIGRRIVIKKSDLDNSLKEIKSLKYKRD